MRHQTIRHRAGRSKAPSRIGAPKSAARAAAVLAAMAISAAAISPDGARAQDAIQVVYDRTFVIDQPPGACRSVAEALVSSDNAFCALTGVQGNFSGAGETANVGIEGPRWVFRGASCQPGVSIRVTCTSLEGRGGSERLRQTVEAQQARLYEQQEQLDEQRDYIRDLAQELRRAGVISRPSRPDRDRRYGPFLPQNR